MTKRKKPPRTTTAVATVVVDSDEPSEIVAVRDEMTSNEILELLAATDNDMVNKLRSRLAAIEERGFDPGPVTTSRLRSLTDRIGGSSKSPSSLGMSKAMV